MSMQIILQVYQMMDYSDTKNVYNETPSRGLIFLCQKSNQEDFVAKCGQICAIGQKEKSVSVENQQLTDSKGTQSGGRTRTPFSIGV